MRAPQLRWPAARRSTALLLFIAAVPCVPPAIAAPVLVQPAFGYRIGDSIVAVGRVAIDERAQLDNESLPKTGRINGWLALEEVRVVVEPGAHRITRVFQVTASGPEPKLLFLPKAELRFRLDGRELAEQLEAVPVSVSPLAPAAPILRSGFGDLRPDRDAPEPRAGEALRRARQLAAALVVLGVLWLGLRMIALRRRGYAPFGMAARRLRRLARESGTGAVDATVVRSAFRIMHDAFNEAAGQAVFSSQREDFLARHPRFAAEASAVRAFFERSDAVFFGGHAAGTDVAWLVGLARRLARIEQPGR